MKDMEYYFKSRETASHPVRRAEAIEPGEIYRTKDGHKVKVYTKEAEEIHGAILVNNRWQIDTWNLDGSYLRGGGKPHDRDIHLSQPLKLTPGHEYKTRDGRKAKIIFINLGLKSDPVVGYIQEKDGFWYARSWNDSGFVKRPYWPNNDLVTEWSNT